MFWVFHVIRDYARTLEAGASRMLPRLPRVPGAGGRDWSGRRCRCRSSSATTTCCPANFLDDGERLWLIDFEYAGFGTAHVRSRRRRVERRDATPRTAEALAGGLFRRRAGRRHAGAPSTPCRCASLLREAMWSHGLGPPSRERPASTTSPIPARTSTRLDAALAAYRGAIRRRLSPNDPAQTTPRSSSSAAASSAARPPIIWRATTRPTCVLLEQGQLTSGSTWHAAGLVGQLRSSASITQVLKYSVELYKRLEAETGLETGWKMTGCLRLARNQDRWTEYRRLATTARSFGMEMHLVSPDEVKRMWPLMDDSRPRRRELAADRRAGEPLGHHAVAGQGRADARGEDRRGGAGHRLPHGQATGSAMWRRAQGVIACEKVVNCAGQWARQVGAMAGVNVPLQPVKHQYIITEPIAGLSPDAPTIRDPDRPHLLQGGGRRPRHGRLRAQPASPGPRATCRTTGEFHLFDDDWDHFEQHMEQAIARVPALAEAGRQADDQRAGELHAGRQLHPRPGAGMRQHVRRRGLQRLRHRLGRRRGLGAGRLGGDAARHRWTCGSSTSAASRTCTGTATGSASARCEAYGKHYTIGFPHEEWRAGGRASSRRSTTG